MMAPTAPRIETQSPLLCSVLESHPPMSDPFVAAGEKPAAILHLEDNYTDAELVEALLEASGLACQIARVQTKDEFSRALRQQTYDLILADYGLPGYDGLSALKLARAECPGTPFLFVSGTIGEEAAIQALTQGATDYVLKGRISRLVPAVHRALREADECRERERAEQALRENERRFRALIENSSDGIILLDSSLAIQYVSASGERLTGYSAEEVLGHSVREFVHPEDLTAHESLMAEFQVAGGQSRVISSRIRCRDREWRWMEGVYHNLLGEPSVSAIVLNFRDITERRRGEQLVQDRDQMLLAIHQVTLEIGTELRLPVLLTNILRQAQSMLKADRGGGVYLREPSGDGLRLAHGSGINQSRQGITIRKGQGLVGRIFETCQPLVVDDYTHWEARTDLGADLPNTVMGVPLFLHGQVIGVLTLIADSQLRKFTDEDVQQAEMFAGHAAIALDNAGLFERLDKANRELSLAYEETIEGWSQALDLRDKETEGHSQRVTELTMHLAEVMEVPLCERCHYRRGALLHDIGKVGVPDSILLKPAKLTGEEREVMQRHPGYAFEILSPIEYLRPALDIPHCHHEKWDGTGYPRGLQGKEIPLAARIFAVVDVWDALRSDRPYRAAWSHERAREYLHEQAGVQFDPDVVKAFLQMIEEEGKSLSATSAGAAA